MNEMILALEGDDRRRLERRLRGCLPARLCRAVLEGAVPGRGEWLGARTEYAVAGEVIEALLQRRWRLGHIEAVFGTFAVGQRTYRAKDRIMHGYDWLRLAVQAARERLKARQPVPPVTSLARYGPDDRLTLVQAEELTGVPYGYWIERIADGKVEAEKEGGRRYVRVRAVRDFLSRYPRAGKNVAATTGSWHRHWKEKDRKESGCE